MTSVILTISASLAADAVKVMLFGKLKVRSCSETVIAAYAGTDAAANSRTAKRKSKDFFITQNALYAQRKRRARGPFHQEIDT